MSLVIAYQADGQTVVVHPSADWTQSMTALAALVVPAGTPYEIVEEAAVAPTPDQLLQAHRATLIPYARAFFEALKYFPAEGFEHMLDQYTQTLALRRAQDPYDSLVVWDQRIVQIIRLNPDMDAFGAGFGIPPTIIDAICEVALVIESPASLEEKSLAIQAILGALA